jgi:hypothetical protein
MRYAVVLLLLLTPAFAGSHAPLPPALLAAKTMNIDNASGDAKLADRCYDELSKWGRFKVVSDPKQADVIFQIGTHVRTAGYSGHATTNQIGDTSDTDISFRQNSIAYTTVSVVAGDGQILWSDTRRWGTLLTGFRSATRSVIKELRSRIEEQEKH